MIKTELQNTKRFLKEGQLTFKYVLTSVLMSALMVVAFSVGAYSFLRMQGIYSTIEKMLEVIPHAGNVVESETGDDADKPHAAAFTHFSVTPSIVDVSLFSLDSSVLASSNRDQKLNKTEIAQTKKLFKGRKNYYINDTYFYEKKFWKEAFTGKNNVVPVMLSLRHADGSVNSVARLAINFESSVKRAEYYASNIFVATLLMSLVMISVLYRRFRTGVITIRRQSEELNQQIISLSELLGTNKELRLSMKTASSRAVELNEQFLRRTGADLHDGPAQLISFAVLRLNQISKTEGAKKLGQEFHGIKEALENSLEEIRGISSGLVLPELETMSLEQCLQKVVILHRSKSDCEVKEYYQNLPEQMPLPIKICAYRFLQEGLNNADRHGKAKKCRVTSNVTSGVLSVSLKDNGQGFRKSLLTLRGEHLGLLGLKDRIESLGGTFSVNSELGVGTAIKLSLNLVDED